MRPPTGRRALVTALAVLVAVCAAVLTPLLLRDPGHRVSSPAWSATREVRWAPGPGAQWQWQLRGTPEVLPGVAIYGMDGQSTPGSAVQQFAERELRTICYLSAGTLEEWRPDAERFPAGVVGEAMADWPGERWLDVRQLEVLLPLMAERMDECARKGFDAVEPDNVDGHLNRTGFPLEPEDQLRYNRALADLAHERGLSVALKNDIPQVGELEPDFDFAINEECFRYDECEAYEPFVAAGKAVLNVEYVETPGRCDRARELGISSMRKNLQLDAWRSPC
ncbi:endo alpha-1,4 polygalactosaminidase [Kocuria flava]|uniref:endo alpha-1,4 polygalactosaminidase n=1 Tax=Kocuria flava TaxID=446860 RepID=UPI003F1B9C06